MRLEGKAALITGAGSGIGRAAAVLFANEGARVALCDIDSGALEETASTIEETGGQTIALRADVSSSEDVQRLVGEIAGRWGELDVLYNNAGFAHAEDGPATDVTPDVWAKTLDINLTGSFLCCKHALPLMIRSGGGSVINTSSPVAVRPRPAYDAYTVAKGGLLSLTRSLAQNFGPRNIRVNAILPGITETGMTREGLAQTEFRHQWLREVPLGRIGTTEDIARAALFLASDEASFITGVALNVDGGWLLGPAADTTQ